MTKVNRPQGGDQLVVESGGLIQIKTGGMIVPNNGTQAGAITNAVAISGGDSPTEAEHNTLITKLNSVLAALRGVGIIA
ncbi:hypothetical protein [Mesorhizobium sp. CN2-181]|uniref:hypothetical protein n=1 Tax=Mesorhizobium yinganensis TaxID=3157707 RepID=UPI0032B74DD5